MEHELWFTALLNWFLAAPVNLLLNAIGTPAEDPAHPVPNWFAMEILVALVLVVLFAILRPRLSVTAPGRMQQTFELVYEFVRGQADDIIGHGGEKFLAYFGTIFLFILFMNLSGLVPSLESATMYPYVPAGCAVATFLYYNLQGIKVHRFSYWRTLTGGTPWFIWILMIPIEIISHLARPVSLTIRLFANMFAGEQVTLAFLSLVPLLIPVPFMGLHIFVGMVQAYVFMLLSMVYVGIAIAREH